MLVASVPADNKYPTVHNKIMEAPYSWAGRIVGRPANKTHYALCLAADPNTYSLVYMAPIARRCPDMPNAKDPWTDWQIKGMFHAPNPQTYPIFTGFLYHPALDACALYTLDMGFMQDESPRGTLMLENCDSVKKAYEKASWKALNNDNQRFLSKFQMPLGTQLAQPSSPSLSRW
ncbi:hypothetical protein ABW21_db0204920 [Orbilia brochopaga]|nr:hypothetical protein ABW21_db0204920 [Drechslerella brochopaga]